MVIETIDESLIVKPTGFMTNGEVSGKAETHINKRSKGDALVIILNAS